MPTPDEPSHNQNARQSHRSPVSRQAITAQPRRPIRAGTVAVASALLLAACTGSPAGVPTAAHPPSGPYVALGDSYTSAPGVPDQTGTPAGCQRSDHDYPALVARNLKLTGHQVHDVSCSGAQIADLTTAQPTDNGTNPAQLAALSTATALVTLGIGGNDIDFAAVLTRCVELDLIPTLVGNAASDMAPCRANYTSDGLDQIHQKIQTAADNLAEALAQIKQRAPHARVYVVGYPALLPSGGAECAHTLGITPGDVAFLNTEELTLNSMLQQHARSAGAVYVDTYTASLGHDACSAPATRWIEPLIPSAPAAPMHPNATGEQGMADAVTRTINGS